LLLFKFAYPQKLPRQNSSQIITLFIERPTTTSHQPEHTMSSVVWRPRSLHKTRTKQWTQNSIRNTQHYAVPLRRFDSKKKTTVKQMDKLTELQKLLLHTGTS